MEAIHDGPRWMLKLDAGEPLPETLAAWAARERIEAAAVVAGIGLVRDTEIGYLKDGKYEPKLFAEPLELLGLSGSIAYEDGTPSVHLHLIGGRPDHTAVGGHLLKATIGLLAEIRVDAFPGRRFRRPLEPSRGVRILRLSDEPTVRIP
jgi:uncharacterized protein